MNLDLMDKEQNSFGLSNVYFKKVEMLDDNGMNPIILNRFKKLKIKGELGKDIGLQHERVINNLREDSRYKAKKEKEKE